MRQHDDLDVFANYPDLLEMAAAAADMRPRPSTNGRDDEEDDGRPFRGDGRQSD
jgi:hypothetical protein